MIRTSLFSLILLLFTLSCTTTEPAVVDGPERTHPSPSPLTADGSPAVDRSHPLASIRSAEDLRDALSQEYEWVEQTLASLTLEQKVAQMISPRVYAHYQSRDSEWFEQTLEYVRELDVGGLTFFAGDVHELATLVNDFQNEADIPLLISADFERGAAMRIRRATDFPVAMALGAAGDEHLAYRMGLATALEGRAMGVHQNFAPLGDVNNNPDNPVINTRSFGEDPGQVGVMASAFTRGLHDGGMISTGKHFPGHGDTDLDSHVTLPVISHCMDRLNEIELPPFRKLIEDGVASLMTAHIAMPCLTEEEDLPATLSRNILTDLLRSDMDFPGLIVTDALDMYGIDLYYSREEAAIRAVRAGADVLLLPPDPKTAIDAVVSAVRLGEIEEERIDRSVRKILVFKKMMDLNQTPDASLTQVRETVGHRYHQELAKTIARRSMTLVRNRDSLFPLDPRDDRDVLLLTISDREELMTPVHRHDSPATVSPAGQAFRSLFDEEFDRVTHNRLDPRSNDQEIEQLIRQAEEADLVIVQAYVLARDGAGDMELPGQMSQALDSLRELRTPTGVISFGDPYFIARMPQADAFLAAWSPGDPAIRAAFETLIGENNPEGLLPIRIPDIGEIGDGLNYE